jgi:hypothetical protein
MNIFHKLDDKFSQDQVGFLVHFAALPALFPDKDD